ncbi:MAG: Gfo/Idh/MocA family oxidoreductase [Dysgonamonadaceae bacterium]|jgi:predicted dehydrogenase|nr:Gfo/Idh/MocA family oxidoreductase [Dysgonamonadaceae bacterium]
MNNNFSRRKFLKASALGSAGFVLMPGIAGCSGNGGVKDTRGERVRRIGFIGLGQQARNLLYGFIGLPDVEIVAGADVYAIKRTRFVRDVVRYGADKMTDETQRPIIPDVYEDYQEILKRDDINTVVIATPDHWHAFIAIAAAKAKKDIYLEKPMTFTVDEGKKLVAAVRSNGAVLAVGSQQRSSAEFQHAVKIVQSGVLGKISEIKAFVGDPPKPYDLPEEEIPAGLNWEKWLGPNPHRVHFNNELNPAITLERNGHEKFWGGWRWYKETGGGYTTDWGAHVFDIAQWALGKDGSGPVKVIPPGADSAEFLTYIYDNGTVMTQEQWDGEARGCKFIGEKGWITVERGRFQTSNPDWAFVEQKNSDGTPYETSVGHQENFIIACRERGNPVATVETGHSSCTVCNIGNIAIELGRALDWDPAKQEFVGDEEANAKLSRQYYQGYSL